MFVGEGLRNINEIKRSQMQIEFKNKFIYRKVPDKGGKRKLKS